MVTGSTPVRADDRLAKGLQAAVLAAPLVLLAYMAWRHRWIFDDGFINFRTVRQLEAGHGPVFNVGERVESYTSALWIVVLLVGDVLTPLRLEWVAVLAGIVGTVAGLALATSASVRLVRRAEPRALLVPLGALAVVAVAPNWYFATSGLEGGLSFAWIGATFFASVRWALGTAKLSRSAAVLIGLGWLVRPDLVLLSIVLLVVIVATERSAGPRTVVAILAWAAAIPVAYQVFRMGYFAQLLPNTAIAKEAGASRWDRGWDYVSAFAGDFHLWIPGVLGLVLLLALGRRLWRHQERRALAVSIAFVVGGLLQALYVTRVGGDYIPARLLLPSFFTLAMPLTVVPITRKWIALAATAGMLVWAGVAFVGDRPGGYVYGTAFGIDRSGVVTLDAALQSRYGPLVARFRHEGIYFDGQRLDARPGPAATRHTVDESGIGIIGYALRTDVRVLDWLGLVDPMTAHFAIGNRGLPGHEKPIPGPWAAARLTAPGSRIPPTVFQPPALFAPLIPRTAGAQFDRQVAQVRRTLRCRRVRDFVASYRAPLTAGGFLSNIADSFSNSSFRVPPDPTTALRQLCGG